MPGTPESLRKAREALARRRAERAAGFRPPSPGGALTFSEAFDTVFANWFAGPTWRPWRTVGKAIFAEPMTDAELAEFQTFTGRTVAPTMPAREVWLAIGRRAGKDWFCAAVIVFLACFRTHPLKVGDLGRVMLLAVDQDQASEAYRYISELIDSIPTTKAMVTKRSTKLGLLRLTLNNRIEIMVKSADQRRLRGRTVLAIVASEVAHWWDDDTNANPASEVLRALRPSMLGVPGAVLLAVSSPHARKGVLHDNYAAHWGQDGNRILVWQASTMAMRPDTLPEFLDFLEEELRADPVSFDSEYRANFRRDMEDFISLEQVQAVIVAGRAELPAVAGTQFYAFLDAAGGGGKDSAALCIATLLPQRAHLMAPDLVEAAAPHVSEVSTEAPQPAEPGPDDTLPSGRARGWKVTGHVPLRPETVAEERARYPERIKAWKQAKAIWDERQASDYITEDVAHRTTCEVRRACPHPAHVRKRRALLEETVRDRRHLGACLREEDACLDASHLLPPHPVDVRLEFCCPSRCFPLGDVRSLTECLCVPPQVRARRQAELQSNRHAFGDLPGATGFGPPSVIKTNYLSPTAEWNLTATRSIHDLANVPLRDD